MRTVITVLAALIFALAPVGCICKYPNLAMQVHDSLSTVQQFYDALVSKFLDDKTNATVHGAVISADLALHLAGALQKQWCPDPELVAEAQKLAAVAKAKARVVGIK